jgi:RNA polymerase sigma factor (sigma-70 family)
MMAADSVDRRAMATKNANHILIDEPTIELIVRARAGNALALEALLQRCLPPLKRWAHGKLPDAARGHQDTGDLVQEVALRLLRHLDTFEPRHVGAMQAYLRQSVINRVCDEVRRAGRQPMSVEVSAELPSDDSSPLEEAIAAEAYDRYRTALATLKPREREVIVARVEMQWSTRYIAQRLGFSTTDAARMSISRALRRLMAQLRIYDDR